jgi:diguanylate cyclase (GGDEF)-like protein/PAS domain S-box-containing protein
MKFSPGNLSARWSVTAITLGVIYTGACALTLVYGLGGDGVADFIGAWGRFPLMILAVFMLGGLSFDATLSNRRRRAYQLFFAAMLLDVIASVGWGYDALTGNATFGSWPDVLYLTYYPLIGVACSLLYFDLGGRFNTTRAVIDFVVLALGFGAFEWFTVLAPLADMNSAQLASNWSAAGYGIGNIITLVAGAMVAMQITDWRSERPLVWLISAMLATLIADLFWVNGELRGTYRVGGFTDFMYFFFYLGVLMCAHTQREQRMRQQNTAGLHGDLRGSLPIVALMAGIVSLLNDRLHLSDFQAPLLIIVLLSATVLVIVSQAIATREVVGLHREVATRRFDERLTELVRRSSDMIVICDVDGIIRYASPSSEQLLRAAPAELLGRKLDDVLGPEAGHVRTAFDEVLRTDHSEQTANFSIPQSDSEKRSFKVVVANLRHVESIRGITLNIRDVSDATRLHDQLRTLAFHDPLTLLANRALFADRVHQAIRHVADGMTPAVLFIDLDNFKTVNDSLGHSAGDQLLRGFATRLVQCTRAGDTVARLGGDEFAVLIDHASDVEAAMVVARQIIEACKHPYEVEDRTLRIGASIGVTLADRLSNVERLLRNADAAMYAAKSNGKGHAQAFAPEMLRAARRRMRIENELQSAIELNQLEAHYQPIVDLASRHLVGVEALMRWRHPTRGLVMPKDFIPLAEETGQIVPMTQWMLDRACADAVRLKRELVHGEGIRVAVNVSSRYLNHGDIIGDVRAALLAHAIMPDSIVLEVTESLLLENSPQLERTFSELKMIGVRLALDDFGTGYSSLAYLHRFPIDILKIDRSFVERLAMEDDDAAGVDAVALARAILSLADALGLDTVAEGIEHDAQRDILMSLGCKTGQGYAFGKPMPIEEVFGAAVTRRRSLLAQNLESPVDFSATGRFRAIKDR